MEKSTIVFNENGIRYKISKVIFYGNNGGFGLLAPYHKAKKGYLIKYHLDPDIANHENIEFKLDEALEYSADDRVKLSIHSDGFVQFSGENPGKILSGIDADTGRPKGLGLFIPPLSMPISSGPAFGMQVWGLNEFEPVDTLKKDEFVIEYFEDDYEYRYTDRGTWNSYIIEFFIFPLHFLNFSFFDDRNRMILKYRHPQFRLEKFKTFTFQVLPYVDDKYNYIIGMLVSREKINFTGSGFIINSPGQSNENGRMSMMAGYPATVFPFDIEKVKSVDYRKNN